MASGIDLGSTNARARQRLDERLSVLKPITRYPTPARGWIRAIRDALGMSGRQLAVRLKVSPQNVANIERSESNGTVQIATLRRVAEALDCTLVYALVPNTSLEEMVRSRAHQIASREMERIQHTMSLEDQLADHIDLEKEIERHMRLHVREKDLWEEPRDKP